MSEPLALDEESALIFRRTQDACDVYLYNEPLQKAVSSSPNLLSSISSSLRSVYRDSWDKHWLVILHYGEELVYVCDSGADHTGMLKGNGYWQDWTIVQGNDYSYKQKQSAVAEKTRECAPPKLKLIAAAKRTQKCAALKQKLVVAAEKLR
ncbi:hypothetical protein HPB52_025469 [Rhipicephalus sanguineus]|uniref:Uncharacterized protein n=1 Tax=Rhipicephalus sanguineus TaxID=34632 RepID=A0A9D4TD10_RHISA|nr:hypothetical protein HPB52_025469 [Rhipicephalus sanguineus]